MTGDTAPPTAVAPLIPLLFDPGTRWHYGTSVDWAGKLVEKISGLTLEQYFQRNILQPLGMKDTSFLVPPEKFDRLVSTYRRQADGKLERGPAHAARALRPSSTAAAACSPPRPTTSASRR